MWINRRKTRTYQKGLSTEPLQGRSIRKAGAQDIIPFSRLLRRKVQKLVAIAIGISAAFNSVIEEHLLIVAMVFDRYHISALMNKGIEHLRRRQESPLDEEDKKVLQGTRFLAVKNHATHVQEGQNPLVQTLLGRRPAPQHSRHERTALSEFREKTPPR